MDPAKDDVALRKGGVDVDFLRQTERGGIERALRDEGSDHSAVLSEELIENDAAEEKEEEEEENDAQHHIENVLCIEKKERA